MPTSWRSWRRGSVGISSEECEPTRRPMIRRRSASRSVAGSPPTTPSTSSSTSTRRNSSPRGGIDMPLWRRRAAEPDTTPIGSPSSTDVPHPRYFFIHVMKTAGRTLMRHFRGNFDLDQMYPYGKLDVRYEGDRVDIRHHLRVACLLELPEE